MERLKQLMKRENIDLYIIPTNDYHDSEYISEYFECRRYLSGFTGSAGTLVVGEFESVLFTDGRYFVQADAELRDSGIELMRMGDQDVPTLSQYLQDNLSENGIIGFDGRVNGFKQGDEFEEIARSKNGKVASDIDLVGEIWRDRPPLEFHELLQIPQSYFGESVESKLDRLRKVMIANNANVHIITSLDDIAWLFNIRGNDVECNPVVFAYGIITLKDTILFMNQEIASSIEHFDNNIIIKPYDDIYRHIEKFTKQDTIMLDMQRVNYLIVKKVVEYAEVLDKPNPTTRFKSIKNQIEINNTLNAHIIDGVAVTKFMYWLKQNVGKIEVTEISAALYLEQLRRKIPSFIEPSFETISAYGSNAAMMHYCANEASNTKIELEGMLLVDSGGQYFEGTTDITRTFVFGEVTEEMKKHFTTVVKSMLRLQNARFLYGCSGLNLDILARGPLWDMGIDYKCGTGHGVGHILNVHEGPNGFRWRMVKERNDSCVLEPGMITTDEPGVYIEGSHGIRIENELLCVEVGTNEYGTFMGFEPITLAPIDLDGIDVKYLELADIRLLNEYHAKVYETISPYLDKKEQEWLKEYTKVIEKI